MCLWPLLAEIEVLDVPRSIPTYSAFSPCPMGNNGSNAVGPNRSLCRLLAFREPGALDALFEGDDQEELSEDEILRYDVQKSGQPRDQNPKVHYDLGLAYKEMFR